MSRDAMLQSATAAQTAAFAAAKGISEADAAAALAQMRDRQLALRRDDPFSFGYEPPVWYVVKALLRNPAWSDYERAAIARRCAGASAEDFSERMRRRLGFAHPVTRALIMGANRSGKTDFALKFCMQTLRENGKIVCSGAQTHKTQKQNQMARAWNYMPNDWKAQNVATKKSKDVVENISYTPKNGFAGSRVTFANGSILNFVTYEQQIAALEGVEYDVAHLDEEYGVEFYNLMTTRITSRAGVFLGTFTPLHGYTPQIAKFLNGANVVRWHRAYLRPKDGGGRMPWAELNLSRGEYEALVEWRRTGMQGDCGVPESRPEDCFAWLDETGDGRFAGPGPDSRVFDFTPRVAVCQGGDAAAVWFFGSDNPYGLPAELIAAKMADENAEQRIFEAVYGMARDLKGRIFKTSAIDDATVDDADIPKRLVRFMVCDPAPERNWCIAWFGFDPETGTLYLYREWPGSYEIPGEGVPGPWVVQSDRNGGLNDGARGDAQNSFGWGYEQIRDEIARLEGWGADGESDAAERMEFRILDSRAASQSKISSVASQTLLADLEEYMSGWIVSDGQRTEVGYSRMTDKLAAGKLKFARSCQNAITCLKMLTGRDGQKGAAKDFVDLVRYATMSDCWSLPASAATVAGDPAPGPSANASRRAARPRAAFGTRQTRVWW